MSEMSNDAQIKTVRTVVRNSGFTALSDLLDRLANIFVILYLSRYLGAASVGIYTLAISYFFIGSRFAFWGLDHLLIRDVAQKPTEIGRYVVNFVFLRILLSLAAIGLLAVFVQFLPYAPNVRTVILIFLFGILGENVINIAEALFIAAERMEFLSIVALFSGLVKLGSCFIVIAMGGGVQHIAIAFLTSSVLTLLLSLGLLRQFMGESALVIDFQLCREQLYIARPFLVVAVTFILNNRLDTVLLSLFISEAEIGYYGAAVTIITAITMLPQGIATAIFPIIARMVNPRKLSADDTDAESAQSLGKTPHDDMQINKRYTDKYRQIFKYMLILAFPLSLGLLAVADKIVPLIFAAGFSDTIPVLRVLALFVFFNALNVLNSRLLIVDNRQDLIARFQAITLVVNIVLLFLLVPFFGIVGAAIAKVATILLLYLYLRSAVTSSVIAFPVMDLTVKPGLASLGMVVMVIVLYPTSIWLQIGGGALTYVCLIVFLGTITKEERTMWRDVLRI